MRLINTVSVLLAGTLLVCCVAGRKTSFNSLQLGMKKSEVILMMGKPDATRAGQNFEYIIYKFMGNRGVSKCVAAAFTPIPGLVPFICKQNEHFVKLKRNIVTNYGLVTEVDLKKDPDAHVLKD